MPVYTLRPHSPSDTIIVYLHGGGYVSTAVLPHSLLVDTLARKTGADVVMPLYPLAPHHTWQEAHQLVLNLYLRILSEIRISGSSSWATALAGAWRPSSPYRLRSGEFGSPTN